MWMEELANGKFKYIERYIDPLTKKSKKTSLTMTSKSRQAHNEASRILNKRVEELEKDKKTIHDITFEELYTSWKNQYIHLVADTTFQRSMSNLNVVKKLIKDDYLVSQIDDVFLQKVLDEVYFLMNYSFSTTKQIKSLLSQLFTFAYKYKHTPFNYSLNLTVKQKRSDIEKAYKLTDKFLEKDELKLLIEKVKLRNKRYALMIEFLSFSGMRYGEMIALKYENVTDEEIEINGTIDYQTKKISEGVKNPTKNKKDRTISQVNKTREILKQLKEENELVKASRSYDEKNFYFTSIAGHPIHPTNFNRTISEIALDLGIKKDISSHIFRHTHISFLTELGIDLKTIMNRVGHSKADITLEIYTHVTKKMESNMVEKINSISL
ncbi:tyrosine-type recombinase/integrase [Vagococcus fluvialis]|uniref:tyrosine-type recombinase/integrase n=1 Tax=Vagococcus fluvialis TaxID=2738 RepID=UPI002033E0CA|nr:site-specific integrase [Vagococcus fluvialis]MCM2138865.1 site-specific integrase [Vagococcus fluvialis]